MNQEKKEKIQSILNCFETGSEKGNYAKVSIFADGPGNRRQITYGKSQTTEYGLLKELLEMYVAQNGLYSKEIAPYLKIIEKESLVNNKEFINLLKKAGKDDAIMESVQDEFFDEFYWEPAYEWFQNQKFTLPLSMLGIYDSFIQSGGILGFLRQRFKESPPSKGGNEKEWIRNYVAVRHHWLANHKSRPILRKTIYRTKNIQTAIDNGDWYLDKPFNANGTIVI